MTSLHELTLPDSGGILVKIGTVKCVILLLTPEKGAELRAKLGDDVILTSSPKTVPVEVSPTSGVT
jgi:hypothetical protein